MAIDFDSIDTEVRGAGLVSRGGFHPSPRDGVPPRADGAVAQTLILVGNAGASLWTAFQSAPEAGARRDPLDTWSRRVVGDLGRRLGAYPLFPFGDPPYLPFIRWAQRAEPVHPSVIGPLIHPDFGLWHAYRGALAFAERIDLPARIERPRPCDTCVDRPCLGACPVDAFTQAGYDVPRCAAHLSDAAGVDCMSGGCLARRACPIGERYRYPPEQAAFHMRAFLAARK